MSENVIPFHINNGVQRVAAESLEGEYEVELTCITNGPCFLLRQDAVGNPPSAAAAAVSVAAGANADFVLAANVGFATKRKVTDTTWYIYAPGDCIGFIKINDSVTPNYGI